jgi:hypothetical protein
MAAVRANSRNSRHSVCPMLRCLRLSATSGRAGDLTKVERLKAAWPFGQPSQVRRVPVSLSARNEWGESRREGPLGPLQQTNLLSPALSSFLRQEEREFATPPAPPSPNLGDSRNCQTPRVSPAKPGDFPMTLTTCVNLSRLRPLPFHPGLRYPNHSGAMIVAAAIPACCRARHPCRPDRGADFCATRKVTA